MQPEELSASVSLARQPRHQVAKTQPWRHVITAERLELIRKTQTEEYQGEGSLRTRFEVTSKK
jgi:hypothetical protein